MTYLAYKRLTTRRKNAKIEARNQQRRTLKELAERRGDTPSKNATPGKAKTRLELRALAPTLQGSAAATARSMPSRSTVRSGVTSCSPKNASSG